MSRRDHYRTRAAEFQARARIESSEVTRRQYEIVAQHYARLAEQAESKTSPELPGERQRHKRANRRN